MRLHSNGMVNLALLRTGSESLLRRIKSTDRSLSVFCTVLDPHQKLGIYAKENPRVPTATKRLMSPFRKFQVVSSHTERQATVVGEQN